MLPAFLLPLLEKIGPYIAVLAVVGGLYLYIQHLRSSIDTLEANVTTLSQTVGEQKEVIEQQKKDVKMIVQLHTETQKLSQQLNESVDLLRRRFEAADIGKLAVEKPALIQKSINEGTADAFRCLEIATGSPMTAEETARAFDKTCINGLRRTNTR